MLKRLVHALAALGFLVCAGTSGAASLSFTRVTGNSLIDIAPDLSLSVVTSGPSTVLFVFTKGTLFDGFITQIYFEDPQSLLSAVGFSSALSSSGVAYDDPATPNHPPGLNPFAATFSLDPNNPQPANGISGGEIGTFIGTFTNPSTYALLETAIADGSFRVALHAQGLLNDESDTFLAVPGDPAIPEPAVSLLGGLALLLLCTRRGRF